MNHELTAAVRERQLELQLDELAGRAVPRDHTEAVLARVAVPHRERPVPRGRLVAAGLALAGLAATLGVAFLQPGTPPVVPPLELGVVGALAQPMPPPASNATAAAPTAAPNPATAPAPTTARAGGPHLTPTAEELRVLRSAEAMQLAERTLAARRQAQSTASVDRPLAFEELSSWQYRNGLEGLPEPVRLLDGQRVTMLGFVLPIDAATGMREFLLVHSLWACCYGTPPDVHGIVRVVLPEGQTMDWTGEPFEVRGVFRVRETREEGYCVDIFRLEATQWGVFQ